MRLLRLLIFRFLIICVCVCVCSINNIKRISGTQQILIYTVYKHICLSKKYLVSTVYYLEIVVAFVINNESKTVPGDF